MIIMISIVIRNVTFFNVLEMFVEAKSIRDISVTK